MMRNPWHGCFHLVLTLAALVFLCIPSRASEFDPGRAPFAVQCNGRDMPFSVQAVCVMPGDCLELAARASSPLQAYRLQRGRYRKLRTQALGHWQWQAPQRAGVYSLVIRERTTGARIQLNCLVMVPTACIRDGKLNGYRIGNYLQKPSRSWCHPPQGLVEVNSACQDIRVSPHFTLRQFLCKQSRALPGYLMLDEQLLIKLEGLLEQLNDQGYACDTLEILSGYRTPAYNRRLGNVQRSLHVWGGAADVYVDVDQNGWMDDLNRDGSCDFRDAVVLARMVDKMDRQKEACWLPGGLGVYNRTGAHGPFVHVDIRGQTARWGLAIGQGVVARTLAEPSQDPL